MNRILIIPALGLLALLSVGCSNEGRAILAQAGGGNPLTATVSASGNYTLYHVTEYDMWGAPSKTEEIATIPVSANEHIGFRYEVPEGKAYQADAHSDVVAFAGSRYHANLGPIKTMDEHYYWADPGAWSGYWAMRPERVLGAKAVQY